MPANPKTAFRLDALARLRASAELADLGIVASHVFDSRTSELLPYEDDELPAVSVSTPSGRGSQPGGPGMLNQAAPRFLLRWSLVLETNVGIQVDEDESHADALARLAMVIDAAEDAAARCLLNDGAWTKTIQAVESTEEIQGRGSGSNLLRASSRQTWTVVVGERVFKPLSSFEAPDGIGVSLDRIGAETDTLPGTFEDVPVGFLKEL